MLRTLYHILSAWGEDTKLTHGDTFTRRSACHRQKPTHGTTCGLLHMQQLVVCYTCNNLWFVTHGTTCGLLHMEQLAVCYTCNNLLFVTHATTCCLLHMEQLAVCYTCNNLLFVTHGTTCGLLHMQQLAVCYTWNNLWFVTHGTTCGLLGVKGYFEMGVFSEFINQLHAMSTEEGQLSQPHSRYLAPTLPRNVALLTPYHSLYICHHLS